MGIHGPKSPRSCISTNDVKVKKMKFQQECLRAKLIQTSTDSFSTLQHGTTCFLLKNSFGKASLFPGLSSAGRGSIFPLVIGNSNLDPVDLDLKNRLISSFIEKPISVPIGSILLFIQTIWFDSGPGKRSLNLRRSEPGPNFKLTQNKPQARGLIRLV